MKKTSSKNNNNYPHNQRKANNKDGHHQRSSINDKKNSFQRKSRQKSVRRTDKIISNPRKSSKRTKYGNFNNNVYDSFSKPHKILEMSSTPDNSSNVYRGSTRLTGNNSFLSTRKNYGDQAKLMDTSMRMMKMRQSESTKPMRNMKITGKIPNKLRNSRIRASSNPRLSSKDMHNNSSVSIKGRKGQLLSSSKLGKIINEQTNNLMEQKERIKQIYDPGNVILKSTTNNIKVADEFPSIKNKNPNSASKVVLNSSNNNLRYSQLQKMPKQLMHNSGEWKGKNKHENSATELLIKAPQGLMSTDAGRRENMVAEEFARAARNDQSSHSILGNLSGNQHKLKKQLTKENSTVPIKYDTTAVISEEYSNFDDPFTQMYSNSILSGYKVERNIEEMHYFKVNLCRMTRKMLEKSEKVNKDKEDSKMNISNNDQDNLL